MTFQLHADAVLTRLRTSGSPALTVFDGEVEDEDDPQAIVVPPYLLVRFTFQWLTATDRPDASDINFRSRAAQLTVRIYAVSETARGSRGLLNRASVALLNWAPVVAGRNCTPLRQIDSFEVQPNERTGPAYHELGADYRCSSHPA